MSFLSRKEQMSFGISTEARQQILDLSHTQLANSINTVASTEGVAQMPRQLSIMKDDSDRLRVKNAATMDRILEVLEELKSVKVQLRDTRQYRFGGADGRAGSLLWVLTISQPKQPLQEVSGGVTVQSAPNWSPSTLARASSTFPW